MSDEYFADLWETVRAGEIREQDIANQRKNGELYTATQTIAPVSEDDDVRAFVVSVHRRCHSYCLWITPP